MEAGAIIEGGTTFILTTIFYTVTNSAPSTRPILTDYWHSLQSSQFGSLKVLAAEMLGIGLRCVAIWIGAYFINRHPEGNLFLAISIVLFALVYTFDLSTKRIKATTAVTPKKAFVVIVAGEVGLNLDNIAATVVDASMEPLTISLIIFWLFILAMKWTHAEDRILRKLQNLFRDLDRPTIFWRRQNLFMKAAYTLSVLVLSTLFLPFLPLGWRLLVGVWRTRDCSEELTNGVWVFILVLLAVVSVLDYPILASLSLPYDQVIASYAKGLWNIDMNQMESHEILKFSVGFLIAMLSAFIYLPFFESRVRKNHEDKNRAAPRLIA